jgi:PAS domain S-box-containing protein
MIGAFRATHAVSLSAVVLLAVVAAAGASLVQWTAAAGIAIALLAAGSPRAWRGVAALAAASGAAWAWAAPADELSLLLAALGLVAAAGRGADALFERLPRSGFWTGVAGTALATGAASLVMPLASGASAEPAALAVALLLVAGAVVLIHDACAGSARASVGAWLSAGVALAAVAGLAVGSTALPRLGTAGAPLPLVGAAVLLLGGRALHELTLGHRALAIRLGVTVALIGAANTIATIIVGGSPTGSPGSGWLWIPAPFGLATLAMAGLMTLTATASDGRFGWTVGWACGLLLLIGGGSGLTGLFAGPAQQGLGAGIPNSVIGSVGMMAIGFGAMQIASAELRSQRQRAVWLPALAVAALVAVTLLAWQQAVRQEEALRDESAALGMERAARALRQAVAERAEGLAYVATALRSAPAGARGAALEREGALFGRENPGMVEVMLVGADRRVIAAQVFERGETVGPGVDAAFDDARRAAYLDAETRNRATFLGPISVSRDRGPGYLLVAPVDLDGRRHFVVSSGRFAAIGDALDLALPGAGEIEVAIGDAVVFRRPAAAGVALAGSRVVDTEVLRTPWRIIARLPLRAAGEGAPLSRLILFAGLVLAIVVAAALRLAALAREREVAATAAAGAQLAAQRALAASRAEAARVLDTMAEAVLSLDHDLRLSFANARAGALFATARAELQGRALDRLLPRGIGGHDLPGIERLCRDALADGRLREVSGYAPDIATWIAGRIQPGDDGLTVVLQDVSVARRADVFQREQREILREVAEGAALERVLARICTLYDDLHPGSTCSAVLLDAQRGCLAGGVAPGLPPAYLAAIEGLPIGPAAGSCGTAMHRRERVVVSDIQTDPLWADFRGIAARFGLGACWSQPFLSRGGEPLGSLAVYHRAPREPTAPELAALETLASLCAVAVERDRSLRLVAESEQRFRSLFDLQPDAVFAFDLEGRITAVNEAVVSISGYPREAMLGQAFDGMIDPSERARVRGFFVSALSGVPQRYTTVGVRADGGLRVVDVTNLPIMVDGRMVGVYGVTRDVTEQRAAEARLLERDRFFALSPAVFAISDGRGRYTQVNDALPALLGVSREALLAQPVLDFVHPDDVAQTVARVRALGRGETLAGLVNRQVRADGGVRWLEWTLLRTEQDTIYATARDVTAEKLSQQSEALMQRVIEGSPAVLWRWREGAGRPVDFVTENVAAWGYDKADFERGRLRYEDIVHPGDRAIAAAAGSGASSGAIYRIRRRDGGIAWVDERTAVAVDNAVGVRYRQGITLDVTAVMFAREQEDQLLRAIGDGPAVLWRFNPYVAPSAQMVTANIRQWGYEPEDFTSGAIRFNDLVHPDDHAAVVVGDLARLDAREDRFSREYRLRCADGRWVWISEHLQAVRDDDGALAFCLALSVDVTEQRRASEQERQLRQVIEASPAVLWRFNLADAIPTKLVSANVRGFGYRPEDFTSGRVLFGDLIHRDDRARVEQATREAVDGGARELQVEFRWRTADGRWLWLDERVTLLRGRRGELLDCVSLTLDVTPQREALQAVRERDQFYALSLEVFAVIGPDARFRQVNDALSRVLGFETGHFVGRHVLDYVHPDDVGAVQRQIAVLAGGGRADMVELRCRHAAGGWRWLEWNAAGGAGGLFYCAARDITESKAVAAELRRALHDLELRNAELQDFAFVASHDLQEPLRKVQAFSDRLLSRYADRLDATGADYLRRMDAAASRMQTLIDDLLAYSRVSTRGESFREVDLGQVLREVLGDLEARLESTAADVVRGQLPVLEADPTQMRQLLQNLIGNALKFAPPGRRPRVEVRSEPVDLATGAPGREAWRIVVADNGIGFDNAHADRIFAPFQRLHGRSEYEGTGMGLAIVRKIVERHGGVVSASGVPGVGATFTVDLPARRHDPSRPRGREDRDQTLAATGGAASPA